jgi:hypothetical protein
MKEKSIQCPRCGQSGAGKFCSHCGTSIVSACPSCGKPVKPGSRVCPECGTSLAAPAASAPRSAQTIAPWVALGIAAIALVVALAAFFDRGKEATAPAPLFPPLSSTVPVPGQPVDLASLSPRQAADRLFNRAMAASENGNTVEALQFAPMALQAYNNLGSLDNDARYHVALLHLTVGDVKSARVQIELLRKTVPNHLIGFMLEHQIAERSGKQDSAARANKAFLAAYDAEIATGREEYQDHMKTIERFRTAARTGVAGKK